jgi:glycosyltransferase involved in cell wall biosynthesis
METVDLSKAGFKVNPLMEKVIRLSGTLVTRCLLLADFVALTIPKYVEILEKKYRVKNVLLAPHGSFQEWPDPSFELPAGPMQIMTFGKFGTYKKVDTLIEAFQKIQTPEHAPVELVIAGTDSPNAAGYLESVRNNSADTPNIRFTGYVAEEDVAKVFQDSAVVVFPYNSTTGSSGVLHQAGDYGKAVVLPNLGDFASLIAEEGYTGEFFEPDNADSLATAISNILDNPDRRREMGTQNFMASHGLPISEVVDWYLMHFQDITKKRKVAGKGNWWRAVLAK